MALGRVVKAGGRRVQADGDVKVVLGDIDADDGSGNNHVRALSCDAGVP